MKSRSSVYAVAVATGVVVLMVLFVWKNLVARDLTAELNRLRSQESELLFERDQLRSEVVSLSAINRIKRIASDRLGLVDPPEAPVDMPAVAPLAPREVARTQRLGAQQSNP